MPACYRPGDATLYAGNCLDVLPELGTVDAVVTDPPYHLTGMSDRQSLTEGRDDRGAIGRLNSGFMGKAWDGGDVAFRPETWAAIGAVLKPGGYLLAFGGARTHHRIWSAIEDAGLVIQDTIMWLYGQGFPKGRTQLKPAFEPICVAYKPGGARMLQIDECWVGSELRINAPCALKEANVALDGGWRVDAEPRECTGRWPANVCHDGSDEVMAAFAAFGDDHRSKFTPPSDRRNRQQNFGMTEGAGYSDTGTAARFFYCAKAGKTDRAGSKHPTVKPVALMRWLVRLVTPPGGTVLDPFAGSGTTAEAALAEGRAAILIEREAEYIADIRRRLSRGKEAVSPSRRRTPAAEVHRVLPAVDGI